MDSLATSGPGTDGVGDPIVLFDHLANRWFLAEFSGSANGLSVFVSQTSDPTAGTWNEYFFNTPNFPDYPKFSVWPDGYYVSTNEGGGVPVYVLDRENMLLGNVARPIQRFTAPDLAGFGFQALTPADLDGAAPPTGAAAIFMRHRDDEVHNVGTNDPSQDFLEIWEFDTDFDTPANSSFTQILDLPVAEFDSDLNGLFAFEAFPQPGTATLLDPLREVIMWRLQYRNFGTHETLVGNLVTDVDGTDHGGVRWFELRRTGGLSGTWTLHQEGTIAPDAHNRWMGAIAMDGNGNIAVGYNISSSTVSPGIRYTGRLANDPLGTMPQGEHTLIDGIGFNGSNRWGDYSAMSIDPVDDQTFWFTGEYANSGVWATQIGSFVLEPPSDSDFYQFEAIAGDNLSITTFTPGGGPLDPDNSLDPIIELIGPGGSSVIIDDNSAGDGRNAEIQTTAAASGSYRLRVSGTGMTSGSYVVRVTGHSGLDEPPVVVGTNAIDGSTIGTFPTTYTVNFSESINGTSVQAGDLLIGGLAATGVTQVDGDTFTFDVNPAADIGDGTYAVQLNAANVNDLQGSANLAFAGTFIVDAAGPRLTSTFFDSAPLPANRILTPGPLTFEANFDEALKVFFRGRGGLRTPTAADVTLLNTTTGQSFTATSVNSNPAMDQFTAEFPALTQGAYTLTLISGDDAFEDAIGNDLDGEPIGPGVDGAPTGDGNPGGDYVLNFFVDVAAPELNPVERVMPLGSLIAGSTDNGGVLHSNADQEDFSIFLESGETLSAELLVDAGVTGTIEIVELSLTASSPAAGQPAVLAPVLIPVDGTYTLRVTASSTTSFNLDVYHNAT
ncbi:MAG: pre-peptidase C-terminal domain-containing protein, partial [Planctomycetaceae bacterium]